MMQYTFKLIVAGSRTIGLRYYGLVAMMLDMTIEAMVEQLRNDVDDITPSTEVDVEIVSGHAKGVDRLGERYAEEMGYGLRMFVPNWDKLGRKAGIIRNEEMGKYGDALVAFWDGKSRGTKHMIDYARRKSLIVEVHTIDVTKDASKQVADMADFMRSKRSKK
jgi:hypothetical protein